MPEIVSGQVDNLWVAATMNDSRQLQDIAFGPDEQTARGRCLRRHDERMAEHRELTDSQEQAEAATWD